MSKNNKNEVLQVKQIKFQQDAGTQSGCRDEKDFIDRGIHCTAYARGKRQCIAKDSLLEWKSDDGTDSLKLGGVVRLNQRYEDWEGPNRGFGKLYFDIFRVDLKGKFDDAYINASYLFQDQQKTSIEKAYVGYNLDANNSIEAGLVYKPFTIYPYPQNGWTYHIPFFLGYGNNIAPGLNWNYHDKDWDVKLGYYPQMLETNLRYSPESATYDDLQENAFPSQKLIRMKNVISLIPALCAS